MKVIYLQTFIVLVAFGILYKCIHLYVFVFHHHRFYKITEIIHRLFIAVCLAILLLFVLYMGLVTKSFTFLLIPGRKLY